MVPKSLYSLRIHFVHWISNPIDLVDETIVSNMPFCVWRGICVQPAWFEKDQNKFFTLHSIICSHPELLFCNWRWPQLFFPMLQEREHRRGWTKYLIQSSSNIRFIPRCISVQFITFKVSWLQDLQYIWLAFQPDWINLWKESVCNFCDILHFCSSDSDWNWFCHNSGNSPGRPPGPGFPVDEHKNWQFCGWQEHQCYFSSS